MPKDLAIMQLKREPDRIRGDAAPVTIQNRFLVLRQMGASSRTVTGIHKLAQFVSKLLLTTKGSDLFDPDYGASLLTLLRDPRSLTELEDIKSMVAVHMRDVRRQVIASQTNLSLPADERLKDLQLIRVDFNENELKFEIDLRLISEAGDARELRLGDLVVEEE